MKTYNVELSDLTKRILPIGYEGENLYTQVRVNCEELFRDYPNATAGITIQSPDGGVYPAAVTKDGNDIVWTITSSFLGKEGAGLGQLTFVDNETVIKSGIFHFVVYNSLIATTSDDDATPADIRMDKIAYVNGEKITGTAHINITDKSGEIFLEKRMNPKQLINIPPGSEIAMYTCPYNVLIPAGATITKAIVYGENDYSSKLDIVTTTESTPLGDMIDRIKLVTNQSVSIIETGYGSATFASDAAVEITF